MNAPFVINAVPLLVGEILRRENRREIVRRRLSVRSARRIHRARLSLREQVESNLPLPRR